MTFKRFLLVIFLLGLIPTSCFREKLLHFRMDGFSIEEYRDDMLSVPITASDILNDSIIYFKLNTKITYVTELPGLDFSSKLYAMSRSSQGENGLIVKLSNIIITSDNLFNGNTAGTNLASNFSSSQSDYFPVVSIEDFKEELNDNENYLWPTNGEYFRFVLNANPTDSLSHRFTFDFIYVDGTVQSATTERLTWE